MKTDMLILGGLAVLLLSLNRIAISAPQQQPVQSPNRSPLADVLQNVDLRYATAYAQPTPTLFFAWTHGSNRMSQDEERALIDRGYVFVGSGDTKEFVNSWLGTSFVSQEDVSARYGRNNFLQVFAI